jgi:hypothetical protein
MHAILQDFGYQSGMQFPKVALTWSSVYCSSTVCADGMKFQTNKSESNAFLQVGWIAVFVISVIEESISHHSH